MTSYRWEPSWEKQKLVADYLKHITTLSTGSIVVLATFMDKLFSFPVWTPAVIVALVSFLAAVFCAVVAYSCMVLHTPAPNTEEPVWINVVGLSSLFVMLGTFLAGVVSLGLFAVANLLTDC